MLRRRRTPSTCIALRNRFLRTPNVEIAKVEPGDDLTFAPWRDSFDTALCLNVLEYAEDPAQVVRSLHSVVRPGGAVIVLVPQSKSLFGSVDQTLGHLRRFSREDADSLLMAEGFTIERTTEMNRAGTPFWWLFGKVLGRRRINKVTLKLFDKTVWLWRRVDRVLPWTGLSLIVIGRKPVISPPGAGEPVQAGALALK